jgi:ABC-type nitrate/sulfonate/bicarbonate transport system permease component
MSVRDAGRPLAAGLALGDRARRAAASLGRSDLAVKLLAGLVLLALWEVLVRALAPPYVAKPIGIAMAIPRVLSSPPFLDAAASTLLAVAQGLAIALALGIVVGLSMGRSIVVERTLRFYVNGLYAMPMVAILPLVTMWFGYTEQARLATIVFAAFFSIAINAADGARAVPPDYLEVARSYRAGWRHIWIGIALPASLPYLLAGIRLAAGRALIGAVVAEFFIAIDGLGYYILFNSRTFNHDAAFVAVLLLAAFGISIELLMNWTTRRFMPWYRRDERPA